MQNYKESTLGHSFFTILETSKVNPKFLQDLDVTVLILEHLAANLLVERQLIFTASEFWLKTALDCVAFYHNIH